MAKLAWDKTFETMLSGKCNAALVAGSPLLLRKPSGLVGTNVPPLTLEDLFLMIEEVMPQNNEVENVAGHIRFEVTYGKKYRFRIAGLGYPAPTAIILTRVIDDGSQPSAQSPPWKPSGKPKSWSQIFERCVAYGSARIDALLAVGCPTLLWSDAMVHAAYTDPLTEEALVEMVNEIKPTSGTSERDGYLGFTVRFRDMYDFRCVIFGAPTPKLVLAMRLGVGAADAPLPNDRSD